MLREQHEQNPFNMHPRFRDLEVVKQHLLNNEFMPESGLVVIDFLVRHGCITPENEPDYLDIVNNLRRTLPFPGPKFS